MFWPLQNPVLITNKWIHEHVYGLSVSIFCIHLLVVAVEGGAGHGCEVPGTLGRPRPDHEHVSRDELEQARHGGSSPTVRRARAAMDEDQKNNYGEEHDQSD